MLIGVRYLSIRAPAVAQYIFVPSAFLLGLFSLLFSSLLFSSTNSTCRILRLITQIMSALQSPTSPADDQARPSFPNQLRDTLKASSADGDLARVQDILQIWNFQYASYKPEDLTPALNSAILRGELSVVRLLLESGAATEGTANSLIWDNPDSLAIFEAMVQHGWRVDSVTSYVTRALVMK